MKKKYIIKSCKYIGLTLSLFFINNFNHAQSFNATGTPINVNANPYEPTCATFPSGNSISFNVSGVGVLSPTNQLLEIDMRLNSDRSLEVSVFLKAPDGTCVQISNRMGDPAIYTAQNRTLDYKFRAPNNDCLSNRYPDYEAGSSQNYENGVNSRSGVFSTVGNISTVFNGVNANGTWTMYFGRTGSSTSLPTVQSASIKFGAPLPIAPPVPSQGTSCVNSVVWDGTTICATTAGKNDTPNRPTTAGCSWLNTSENNLWIEFTPTEPDVCINISGIKLVSGGTVGLQSIIVEATNPATPCDNSWNTISCPRDGIYASDVGSTMSHNHCFTATPGNTYYLVVDGNAGAVTEMYITGTDGLPIILPVTLLSFESNCSNNSVDLEWFTSSESNSDYFTLEYSNNGESWSELGRVRGSGNKTTVTSYNYSFIPRDNLGYVRLKQTDFDGKFEYLKTISVACGDAKGKVNIYPNPTNGKFNVQGVEKGDKIKVYNPVGALVWMEKAETNFVHIDLKGNHKGVYIVQIISDKEVKTLRMVKN